MRYLPTDIWMSPLPIMVGVSLGLWMAFLLMKMDDKNNPPR